MGQPVGVFDSGVGGLSVLRAIREELPSEALVYVGDSGNAPYGDKSHDFVQGRASTITGFLIDQRAKAVVVACNTATGIAVELLRSEFPNVPIVAIEPAVKPAASRTKSGVVGVLATAGTLASPNVTKLLNTYGVDVEILTQVGVGLVEQVEKGELTGKRTRSLVEACVRPLIERGADVLVLGCTHYPFLTAEIQAVAGPEVEIIDPATAVARELRRRLAAAGLLAPGGARGAEHFLTTGDRETASPIMSRLWGSPISVERM
ncbi:MAG: glutamate racemase [Vicinamibacterales bacterium]|nr:glutamate racemase [Vicinamibacterales bacterium]